MEFLSFSYVFRWYMCLPQCIKHGSNGLPLVSAVCPGWTMFSPAFNSLPLISLCCFVQCPSRPALCLTSLHLTVTDLLEDLTLLCSGPQHQRQQRRALLHFKGQLKFARWLISYWEQWIESDWNVSSEEKYRQTGAALSINHLSSSCSLYLLSLLYFLLFSLLLELLFLIFLTDKLAHKCKRACSLSDVIQTVSKQALGDLLAVFLTVSRPDKSVRTGCCAVTRSGLESVSHSYGYFLVVWVFLFIISVSQRVQIAMLIISWCLCQATRRLTFIV